METSVINRVKELRKEKGITQEQLASELNVSRQTVNSIERGRYVPSLELALQTARFFNCRVEDIFILPAK